MRARQFAKIFGMDDLIGNPSVELPAENSARYLKEVGKKQ